MDENISGLVSRIKQAYQSAYGKGGSEQYSDLVASMTQADKELRETFQRMTKQEVFRIIGKLNANQPLTSAELDMVKLWIVGDYESYVKTENNFNDWVSDVSRIVDEIENVGKSPVDGKSIMHLRALLLDAKRSCMDIAHFLERKECVARFEESSQELDPEERETLVKMLKFSINSDLA